MSIYDRGTFGKNVQPEPICELFGEFAKSTTFSPEPVPNTPEIDCDGAPTSTSISITPSSDYFRGAWTYPSARTGSAASAANAAQKTRRMFMQMFIT